ncbi:hypothetical protein YC2023_005206 [Brassica napus]
MEKLSIEGGGEDLEQIGAVKHSDLEKIINKSEKRIVNRVSSLLIHMGLHVPMLLESEQKPGAWSPEASPSPFPLFILLRLCPLSPTRRDAWSSGRSSAAGSLICSGEVRSVVGKLRSGAPVRL